MDSSSALRESQFSTRIDVSGPEASRSGYYQTLSDTEAEHHGVSRNRYSGFLSHLRQCFSDVTEDGKLDKFADRGSGWYEGKRARLGEPSLVESGRQVIAPSAQHTTRLPSPHPACLPGRFDVTRFWFKSLIPACSTRVFPT